MSKRRYYTLIASLPYLPKFYKLNRLPINEIRLNKRREMLDPKDTDLVERATEFLLWHRQSFERTAVDVYDRFRKATEWSEGYSSLIEHLRFRKNMRFIVASLRMKARKMDRPVLPDVWKKDSIATHVIRNWESPDFKLGAHFPWIEAFATLISEDKSFDAEKLLLDQAWESADKMGRIDPFGLEAFLGYLFKWDISYRWLQYNEEQAKIRFKKLVEEIIHEQSNSLSADELN